MNIQETLQNRTAIKYNEMNIEETGKIYVESHGYHGIAFSNEGIKNRLINGDFENIVKVIVEGPNGQSGPNIKPSRKGINRMLSIIRDTQYRIIQQNGLVFTLEGAN